MERTSAFNKSSTSIPRSGTVNEPPFIREMERDRLVFPHRTQRYPDRRECLIDFGQFRPDREVGDFVGIGHGRFGIVALRLRFGPVHNRIHLFVAVTESIRLSECAPDPLEVFLALTADRIAFYWLWLVRTQRQSICHALYDRSCI